MSDVEGVGADQGGLIANHDWSAVPSEVQGTLRLLNAWIEEAASRGEGLVCIYL